MRRRSDDEERWAAARNLAHGRETPTAAAILVARTVRGVLIGIVVVAVIVTPLWWSPVSDVLFPPRATSREPASWQLTLGIGGMVVGLGALVWCRGMGNLAARSQGGAGNRQPVRDPRDVLTRRQRRLLDRAIADDGQVDPTQALVAYDRALRFVTSPPPVAGWAGIPVALSPLTFTYRGPVWILVAAWLLLAVTVAVSWRRGRRFQRAAEHWIATRGQVPAPVADPTPGG